MRSIKGASVIEQCLSVAIGIYRQGQPLKYQDYDSTMNINVIKNRFGMCSSTLIGWQGARGLINDITDDQRLEYAELQEIKKLDEEEKQKERSSW